MHKFMMSVVTLLSLVFIGCGGGGSTYTTTSKPENAGSSVTLTSNGEMNYAYAADGSIIVGGDNGDINIIGNDGGIVNEWYPPNPDTNDTE